MNRVAPDGTPESSPPSSRSEGEERVVRSIPAGAFLAAGPAKRVPATEAARKKKAAASRSHGGRMAHASLGPRQRKKKLSAFLFPWRVCVTVARKLRTGGGESSWRRIGKQDFENA